MSFWSYRLRTGRKNHRCEACGRIVPAGDKSYAVAGIYEGDFTAYRECVPCKELIGRLLKAGELDPEGFSFDVLPDAARDAGEAWPPEARPLPTEAVA
jgi:hypothetical protein